MSLAGKTVVITGASSGIARAAALSFADRRARLTLGSRNLAALEVVAEECRRRGGEAVVVGIDVADEQAVEQLRQAAVAAFGGIDIWVNAAAALLLGSFETLPPDAFRRVVETNLFGYVNGSRSAIHQFQAQGDRGVLINVSSMLGVIAEPRLTAYVATKFAIRGFTASLRQEMQDRPGIRICTMLPAAIDTPIYQKAGNLAGRRVRSIIPVYAVERAGQRIVKVADHGRSGEYLVGGFAHLLILANKLAHPLLERLIGRIGPRLQFENEPAEKAQGNLFHSCGPHHPDGGWRRYWTDRIKRMVWREYTR